MTAPLVNMDDPVLEARTVEALTEVLSTQAVKAGTRGTGRVVSTEAETLTLEFEDAQGTLARTELPEGAVVGDEVPVYVDWVGEDGCLHLSRRKAEALALWDAITSARTERRTLRAEVLCETRGGYSVDVGMKAFLPNNMIDPTAPKGTDLLGQHLDLFVVSTDERKARVTLSMTEPEVIHVLGDDIFDTIEVGQRVAGRVARIAEFGAFVDLGGFDALLHVNDLSWGRVNHPKEVVRLGDEIVARVLKVDEDNRRVSLGLKQLGPDPWTTAAERYAPDTRVQGTVISLTTYGAFIEVEPGLEGLVHVSELSWRRVKHPRDILKQGQTVEGLVIRCDSEQQRLKLSLKALMPNPWAAVRDRYPTGTRLKGRIRNVRDFGVFIGIEDGIDGLIHISDLAWGNALRRPTDRYKKGDELEALVLDVDVDRERMSLGVKQLTSDPTQPFLESRQPGDTVKGTVRRLTDFGAFVEVATELWGLVHVSEIRHEPVEQASDVLTVGDEVEVCVLGMDPEVPKVSLSIKALLPEEGE